MVVISQENMPCIEEIDMLDCRLVHNLMDPNSKPLPRQGEPLLARAIQEINWEVELP